MLEVSQVLGHVALGDGGLLGDFVRGQLRAAKQIRDALAHG